MYIKDHTVICCWLNILFCCAAIKITSTLSRTEYLNGDSLPEYKSVFLYLCPILDRTHEGGLWRLFHLDMEPIHPVLQFQWVGLSQLFWKTLFVFLFFSHQSSSSAVFFYKQTIHRAYHLFNVLSIWSFFSFAAAFEVQFNGSASAAIGKRDWKYTAC